MLLEVFIASFVVMLAALGGAVSFWNVIGKRIERHLGLLISFTAGLFLIVSFELGREAIIHSPSVESGLMWIFFGMIFIWLVFKLLPHSHEHGHGEGNEYSLDVRKILTGNAIHNVGDGVLLAAAFSVDIYLGIATVLSVFIHELVQETSIFFVLRKAGYGIGKAVLINFTVSGTILIGSIGGVLLLDAFTFMEGPLLGISAGAFLIVVLQDLIPHSFFESHKDGKYLSHIISFIVGVVVMTALIIAPLSSHSHDYDHYGEHSHDEDDHHDEHEHHHDDEEHEHHNHDEDHDLHHDEDDHHHD